MEWWTMERQTTRPGDKDGKEKTNYNIYSLTLAKIA